MNLLQVFSLCLALVFACCEDKLYINAPSSIEFNQTVKSIKQDDVADAVRAMLGFTVPVGSTWPGARVKTPFGLPRAALLLQILSKDQLKLDNTGDNSYILQDADSFQGIHAELSCNFNSEFGNSAHDVEFRDYPMEVTPFKADYDDLTKSISDTNDALIVEKIRTGKVNTSAPGVSTFLAELNFILQLSKEIARKPTHHGLYSVSISNLINVVSEDQEAEVDVLKAVIHAVQQNIMKAYDNEVVLVTAVVETNFEWRSRRPLAASEDSEAKSNVTQVYNVAKQYTSEYQNTFAAVLFLLIIFTLAILTVSLVMWNMDPGRDSIIYRMTSQRVKMD